jgi:hypothetical protein
MLLKGGGTETGKQAILTFLPKREYLMNVLDESLQLA